MVILLLTHRQTQTDTLLLLIFNGCLNTAKCGCWHYEGQAGKAAVSTCVKEKENPHWRTLCTNCLIVSSKLVLDKNFKGAEKHPAGRSVLGPHQSARKNNILVCLLQDLFLLQLLSFHWSAAANWQHIQKASCFSVSRSACLWGFVLIRELPVRASSPVSDCLCAFAKWRLCVCECDFFFYFFKFLIPH